MYVAGIHDVAELTWTDGAVCINCRPKLSELYQKQVRAALKQSLVVPDLGNRLITRLRWKLTLRVSGPNASDARVHCIK